MTSSMRPGVYVDYQTYPLRQAEEGREVGIVAPAAGIADAPPERKRAASPDEAERLFGKGSLMAALAAAIMENSGGEVWAVPVPEGNADRYLEGVRLLCTGKEPACIVCGGADGPLLAAARGAAEEGGRLLFAALPAGADGAALAESLNCERVILTAPALQRDGAGPDLSAAAAAALVSRKAGDNLFGAEVAGDYTLAEAYSEEELERLLRAGVTVLENGPFCPVVVRCVTTRTKNDEGKADRGLLNVGTVTALDEVTRSLRETLEAQFEAGSGRLTLEAVQSLTECGLLALRERGLISGYQKPSVVRDGADPSACLVSVGLKISQGAAQIRLLASVGV